MTIADSARLLLDAASRLTPRARSTSPRRQIGVFLFWGIGDAVLATPFLRALRAAYPQARIHALGKPWLADLFGDEGLFDHVHSFVPPWTKHRGKYRLWTSEWRAFARAVAAMRRTRFDLLVSLRPDPREALLARFLSAQEFAGYADCGGASWISSDLGHGIDREPETYRGELAAHAAQVLIGERPPPNPSLSPGDRISVLGQLAQLGYRGGPVLALSFGAAHPLRRWSSTQIENTVAQLRRRPGAYLIIESDDAPRLDLPAGAPTLRWRGSLRELKGVLAAADVLLCSDSGVMHVGAALGIRTVSVFGPGSLARFAPRGAAHAAYAVEPMPCRPCHDNCLYSSPLCIDQIDTSRVALLVDRALETAITAQARQA